MDLNKAKHEVNILLEKGAPEEVIQEYMRDKGLTKDMLREHENRPKGIMDQAYDIADSVATASGLKKVHGKVMDAAQWAGDVYRGDVDPAYKDLEGFKGQGITPLSDDMSSIERAKVLTLSDKGYGNIVKDTLADRLLGVTKDKFGQEIINYKGDDGREYQTYVNKPGLDYQDVDRFVSGSIPFAVGAGLAGQLFKGSGLLARTMSQGVTAGSVDAAMQNAAQDQGSGEDYDLARSLVASLGGAGGELLGTVITKLAQKSYIDKATGKLNEAGKAWARAHRIDPDTASESVSHYISQNIERAANPEELAISARAAEFNIPTSKAQRTKLYQDAFDELELEKGLHGQDAETIYKNFKSKQGEAIQEAAFNKVGGKLSSDADITDTPALGYNVQDGLKALEGELSKRESQIWSSVGPMYPKEKAFESLPEIISKKADDAGVRLLPRGTEASAEMYNLMQQFMNGDLKSSGYGILKTRANDNMLAKPGSLKDFLLNTHKEDNISASKLFDGFNEFRIQKGLDEMSVDEISEELGKHGLTPKRFAGRVRYDLSALKESDNTLNLDQGIKDGVVSIDEARRMLLATKNSAQIGSPDARLANKLYEGFNDWIDDAAEKALIIADDPAAHAALKSSREFTAVKHSILRPKDKKGRLTAAGRKLDEILDNHLSSQEVISTIFGRGSAVSELPKGAEQVLMTFQGSAMHPEIGGEAAKKAFDSLKLAYWARLVVDKNGKALSPRRMSNNIDAAFQKHKGAIRILFDKQDRKLIEKFNSVLKDLHVEHPNPSLSSIGVAHNTRKAVSGLLNSIQQRERLVKGNIFRANIISFISRLMKRPVKLGSIIADRQTKEKIKLMSKNKFGYAGGIAASSTIQDDGI